MRAPSTCPFRPMFVTTWIALVPLLCAGSAASQGLVINEIIQNPAAVSDASGEWFEIFNAGAADVDVEGWTLLDDDFDSHLIANGGPLVVPAGGYLVLGNNADSATNGGVTVDYEYGSDIALANGGDELVLLDAALTEVDRVAWDDGATFPDPTGASMALANPALDNAQGANWCESTTPFGAGDLGTPGAANDCPSTAPQVVIHEILQNPSAVSDAAGEWFELYNAGGSAVDIEGWTLLDDDFDSHLIANGAPLVISAGGYLVLGNNGDPLTNGGVALDYEYGGDIALANGSDELVLADATAVEVDRVAWDDGATFPDPAGASMALANPALDNTEGANWCESSTPFGDGDLGTPGAANDCPSTVSEIVINEIIQNPSAVSDAAGEWFEVVNVGSAAVDIEGWTIRDDDFDSHVIANGGPLVIAAGAYAVLGNNADPFTNGGVTVDYEYGSDLALANGGDELVLVDLTLTEVDRVAWDDGATFPDPTGASMALASPAFDNASGANWCESSTPFGDGDLGTPGAANDCPAAALVINEIDYDQPSSDTAEFIEITNVGGAAADLAAFSLELVNGATGTAYDSVALPSTSLAPGEYFVICADAATVANCDLVALSSIQNGAPDAVALVAGGVPVDAVSYEGDVPGFVEGSGVGLADSAATGQDNKGIARFPDGADSDQNNVDLRFVCITPGGPNTDADDGCTANGPALEIFEIQGSAAASPFAGFAVTTLDNVVTALATNGFFMQTPTARSDGDVDTSDGIFVFTGAAPAVAVGDLVDVTGDVVEFFDFTEFSNGPTVVVTGPGGGILPAAVVFDATTPSPDPTAPGCLIEPECYEGMLIEVSGGSIGTGNQSFGTDPFAEAQVTAAARAFREPGVEFPGLGLPPIPTWDGNPEIFELDPDKLGLANVILSGGSTFDAAGVLGFEFGGYELWPTSLTVTPALLPRAVPSRLPGEFTIGSLNVFRLFDDVDDPAESRIIDGELRNDTVVPAAEYARRLAKLALYISEAMDAPDVLAVQEAEKLGVLEDLAAELAALDPALVYSAHLVEGNDRGTIDVGFLTRDSIAVDAITQLGKTEIFSFGTDPDRPLHDRPPLLLEGRWVGGGGDFPFSVLGLHQRSLGGIEDPSDGERVRQKRLEQALSVAQMVQDLQIADPEVHLVVTGDFNAFDFTDGYVDVVGLISGDFDPAESLLSGPDLVGPNLTNIVDLLPAAERYSFIFRGSAQVLDHALSSSQLTSRVTALVYARGNADAAEELIEDEATPLASSDHDGLVLFVDGVQDDDGDGVENADDVCQGTVIPEDVPTIRLGYFRYALTDDDTTFETRVPPHWPFPVREFTTEDTAGCSCEQIIDELGLSRWHERFGCGIFAMSLWTYLVNHP